MHNQDWTLVFFTTLSQLSVGIVLCFLFLTFFSADASLFIEKGLSLKNPVFLALIFIGLATVISFLHLGNPINALNSFNNLSGSWVSREILAIGVYSLSLLVVFVLGWKLGNSEYLKYFLVLSSVIGLGLLWMMIRIYIIPTIPAWNSWYTPLSFASTALCLGLVSFLILNYNGYLNTDNQLIKIFVVFLTLILFIEIISGFFHQLQLERMNTGIDELVFNQGTFYKVFLFRMGILCVVFLAIFFIILKPNFLPGNSYYVWMYLILVLVIVQEFIGRLLFYSSYFRLGT